MVTIPKAQACRFLMERHGLMGARRLRGSAGVLEYVRQVGCVQYDPVDVCGKSHELALLARVHGFSKPMLEELLYGRRLLLDAFGKNMCLMLTQDWPCMAFVRRGFQQRTRSSEAVEPLIPDILKLVHERGCLSAQELNLHQKTDWYCSNVIAYCFRNVIRGNKESQKAGCHKLNHEIDCPACPRHPYKHRRRKPINEMPPAYNNRYQHDQH